MAAFMTEPEMTWRMAGSIVQVLEMSWGFEFVKVGQSCDDILAGVRRNCIIL